LQNKIEGKTDDELRKSIADKMGQKRIEEPEKKE
jgi:hypothetical protein